MAGQTDEFNSGMGEFANPMNGRDNSLGSLSLQQAGRSYTSQVLASAEHPTSVLAPLAFSSNQSDNGTAGDASHWQPGFGVLGSGNGMSVENLDQSLNLRFLGGDENAELG